MHPETKANLKARGHKDKGIVSVQKFFCNSCNRWKYGEPEEVVRGKAYCHACMDYSKKEETP